MGARGPCCWCGYQLRVHCVPPVVAAAADPSAGLSCCVEESRPDAGPPRNLSPSRAQHFDLQTDVRAVNAGGKMSCVETTSEHTFVFSLQRR